MPLNPRTSPDNLNSLEAAIPINSWYPPSVLGPATVSSLAATGVTSPSRSSSINASNIETSSELHSSHSNAGATQTFPLLQSRSIEELRKLLSDKEAYRKFLHSCDEVQQFDHLLDELRKNNLSLARKNLQRESEISELKNQCMIIRTTELASAQEKLQELQKDETEVRDSRSLASLLKRLQGSMDESEESSERINRQFLSGEITLGEFIQNYKMQRVLYHKRALVRLAAVALG